MGFTLFLSYLLSDLSHLVQGLLHLPKVYIYHAVVNITLGVKVTEKHTPALSWHPAVQSGRVLAASA